MSNAQVGIVGAGPAGLMLAGELATYGINVRLYEKRKSPFEHSRAFGLQPRSLEIFALRGILDEALKVGVKSADVSLGEQGSISMEQLDIPHPYMLIIPQLETEKILTRWVTGLGVEIERESEVTDVETDNDGVTLHTKTPTGETTDRFSYVVGCDGARSTVRQAVGIDFPGKSSKFTASIADVTLAQEPPEQVFARHSSRGMVVAMPFADGSYRVVVQDSERMHTDPATPLTQDELSESLRALAGEDLIVESSHWLSRFRSEQRLATSYSHGRVFLAGDAAHLHSPAGGQGINVGMQDAFNLGWKLAFVLQGWSPKGVLDSYEEELRPIAQKVIRLSNIIFKFNTATSLPARLTQRGVKEMLLRSRSAQMSTLLDIAGTDTRYKTSTGQRRRTGHRAKDMPLTTTSGSTTLYGLLRTRKFVLVADAQSRDLAERAASGLEDLVIIGVAEDRAHNGVQLIRPDGHVAYAAKSSVPKEALTAQLDRWLSPRLAGPRQRRRSPR